MPVTTCANCALQYDDAAGHACRPALALDDVFAAFALLGLLASGAGREQPGLARLAYAYADALVAERRRRRDAEREGA